MWLNILVENKKKTCSYKTWVETLSDEDRQGVEEILASDASTASIHRFLQQKFNIGFGLTAFKFHRKHWCSCL